MPASAPASGSTRPAEAGKSPGRDGDDRLDRPHSGAVHEFYGSGGRVRQRARWNIRYSRDWGYHPVNGAGQRA